MPSLEEFPICLALRYEWKLKETRKSENHSNEFKFRNISSFRVRLKHFGRRYACLFFYTANLHKLGLKVTGVSFSSGNGKIRDVEMKEFAYSEAVKNGGLQLFDVFMGCITHCASFNFTVYLSGIIPAYQVEQIDTVQREKLCGWLPESRTKQISSYRSPEERASRSTNLFWPLEAPCLLHNSMASKPKKRSNQS